MDCNRLFPAKDSELKNQHLAPIFGLNRISTKCTFNLLTVVMATPVVLH